jgi:hypothetical protein
MKKIIYLLVLINLTLLNTPYIFSQPGENIYLDTLSEEYNELLFILDRDKMENYFKMKFYNTKDEERNIKLYLPMAIDFYNQKNYEASIDNLIYLCKENGTACGLVYYYLGLCLMDINSFELAKQSFKEAIDYFYDRNNGGLGYTDSHVIGDLFSYDNNGLKREPYFAYYNIACIESLQDNVDLAYEYVCESLFHGCPYITHIRNDDDLQNSFRDRNLLRAIEVVYNDGSQNNLIGKYFDLNNLGYTKYIFFQDENTINKFIKSEEHSYYASEAYEIKNYIVLSDIFDNGIYEKGYAYLKQFDGLDHHGIRFREISSDEYYRRYQ